MSNLYPGDKVSPAEATRKIEEQAKRLLEQRRASRAHKEAKK